MGTSGLIVPSVLHALFHFFGIQIMEKGGSDWNNDSMKPCSRTPSLPRSATTRGWRPVCRQTCRPSSCSTAISAASPGSSGGSRTRERLAIVHADLITALPPRRSPSFSAQHHAGRRDHLDPHQHDPAGEGAADDRHPAGVSDRLHGVRRGAGARNLKPDAIDILPG